jgi:hypothetical protein
MAIYHLSVKPVSRGGGRSATAASAYRAAELVHDQSTGQAFDYTRKRGVEHAEIVLPAAAAQRDINWARDREALWNEAERAENRSNSRVAREYEIALPCELTPTQRLDLVRGFAAEIADRHGVAVDFAIHAPHRAGDERNHHAHLLATTRVIEPGGLGEKATIEWSDTNRRKAELTPGRGEIEAIRERWAQLANEKLLEHGIRIDHRSLAVQGIGREPTSHLGPAVSGMERRGIKTEVGKRLDREAQRGALGREAQEAAQRRLEQAAELGRVEREVRALTASIIDVSGNLEAARRERDLMLAKVREPSRPEPSRPTLDGLQREGRERWLGMRAEQKAKEPTPERVPERGIGKTPEVGTPEADRSAGRSLDEERRQAAERWREHRRAQELKKGREPSREPSSAPERNGSEKDRGRDGPELE